MLHYTKAVEKATCDAPECRGKVYLQEGELLGSALRRAHWKEVNVYHEDITGDVFRLHFCALHDVGIWPGEEEEDW